MYLQLYYGVKEVLCIRLNYAVLMTVKAKKKGKSNLAHSVYPFKHQCNILYIIPIRLVHNLQLQLSKMRVPYRPEDKIGII